MQNLLRMKQVFFVLSLGEPDVEMKFRIYFKIIF